MDVLAKLKILADILKSAAIEWDRDNVPRMGAALAYYSLFALAPLLVVAIGVAGLAFGTEAARGQVVHQIDGLIGKTGAEAVQAMLISARKPEQSIPAAVIGLIALFLGATSAFAQLQGALNTIWGVPTPAGGAIKGFIKGRLLSFGMVLAIGFLLLVSLALSAGLAALGELMESRLPGGEALWLGINFAISFGFITLLFAMIYKILPDIDLEWRDVWIGAGITALFFTLGKILIGLYLGHSTIVSTYGAAGSIVVILLWVYYSAQIVLFGAEVTHAYVEKFGSESRQAQAEASRPAVIQRI